MDNFYDARRATEDMFDGQEVLGEESTPKIPHKNHNKRDKSKNHKHKNNRHRIIMRLMRRRM